MVCAQQELSFTVLPTAFFQEDYTKSKKKTNEPLKPADIHISAQITYGQYKRYLAAVKHDSSEAFYQSQQPDSGMTSPAIYKRYVGSSEFDDRPVVGISWENAMNYCRWKSAQDQAGQQSPFVYRLPSFVEWRLAKRFAVEQGREEAFDTGFSDWLLDAKDETEINLDHFFKQSYVYVAKKDDPPVLKRKVVMGASFLYQYDDPYAYFKNSYYSGDGYRSVSFRIVKEYLGAEKASWQNYADLPSYR